MKKKIKDIEEILVKGAKEANKSIKFPAYLHAKVMAAVEKESEKRGFLKIFDFKFAFSAAVAACAILLLIFVPKSVRIEQPKITQIPNAVKMALESQSYIISLEQNSALEESLKGVIINIESKDSKS